MLARWRSSYNKFSKKMMGGVASTGIHPNTITVFTLFYNIGVSFLIWKGRYFISGWLLIISLFLDSFDGAVARAQGRSSPKGTLIDHVSDRTSEFFVFLALGFSGLIPLWLSFTDFFLSIMTSYVRARAESLSGKNCEIGLVGRLEKFTVITIALFFYPFAFYIMVFFALICLITIYQRLHYSLKYLL